MLGKLLLPELKVLIDARNFGGLREMLVNLPPPDLAELISDLPEEDQAVIFRILPRALASDTFAYLELDVQDTLLKSLGHNQVADILNAMTPDDRTALLEELPAEVTKQLLSLLSPGEQIVARSLLGYPEESIGRLMTTDYIAVRDSWTVNDVLAYIRQNGRDSETLNVVYVVNERGELIDDIRIRDFLLSPLDKRVSELMDRKFVALKATDDQETAVAAFRKHDRVALPVTDSEGVLVGIVTVDDVLDVAEEEATEDIHKFGATETLNEPYLKIALSKMVRKRVGWLITLFLGEMLTASALGYFEKEISRAVVLALFIPLIISSGGNSGSQAATLVIRALALGELGFMDWWRVMWREIISGIILGTVLGAIGFFRISLWQLFTPIYGEYWLFIAITVWITLIGVVLWGTLVGSMLPLFLKRLKLDPATSSAPFVATLVDVTGLVIYFTVAMAVLRGKLL